MNRKSCLLAIIIVLGGAGAFELIRSAQRARRLPLYFERSSSRELWEADPKWDHLSIKFRGREIGIATVNDEGIGSFFFRNARGDRHVTLGARDGDFPGEMTIEVLDPKRWAAGGVMTMDEELDGIPDRRLNFETGEFVLLDQITWKPGKSKEGQTDGVNEQPGSAATGGT